MLKAAATPTCFSSSWSLWGSVCSPGWSRTPAGLCPTAGLCCRPSGPDRFPNWNTHDHLYSCLQETRLQLISARWIVSWCGNAWRHSEHLHLVTLSETCELRALQLELRAQVELALTCCPGWTSWSCCWCICPRWISHCCLQTCFWAVVDGTERFLCKQTREVRRGEDGEAAAQSCRSAHSAWMFWLWRRASELVWANRYWSLSAPAAFRNSAWAVLSSSPKNPGKKQTWICRPKYKSRFFSNTNVQFRGRNPRCRWNEQKWNTHQPHLHPHLRWSSGADRRLWGSLKLDPPAF